VTDARAPKPNGANGHAVATHRLRGIDFGDMRPHLTDGYLIKGVLPRSGLIGIIGPTGSGKMFLATDLAVHIAAGRPWRERKVKRGLVVYAALEGAESAENRFVACREFGGFQGCLPLRLTASPVNLRERADVEALIAFISAAETDHHEPVVAVFIDTLSRAMAGGDENASDAMTALIAGADTLRLRTKAAVILVHHHGKDESRGARGHSSLAAALDTAIEISLQSTTRVATVTKQRDLQSGTRLTFELQPAALGKDDDGDTVTTCMVRHLHDAPTADARRRPSGKNQGLLLAALQEWQRQHPEQQHISISEFRTATVQGISAKRLPEITDSLSKGGWLVPAVDGYGLLQMGSS
jgi:hypothetical protein